jgi:ribosomal protein S18 acetylase RimI-like enzyme
MKSNLKRMIQLADEFFSVKNDPAQIAVDENVMARLHRIHPATMTEEATDDGPIAWMLVIPTTHELMTEFILKEINERELLDATPTSGTYDAVYLCSALVLPEHRGRGLAKRLLLEAIASIRRQHPIASLFYWSFSEEGKKLSEAIAKETGLPLLQREP